MSRSQQRKDRTVAALLTALVVALILVTLFFGGITWDRAALAESSTPGENPKPAPPKPKVVTQKKPSPVKEKEPSQTDRDRQKATSSYPSTKTRTSRRVPSTGRGLARHCSPARRRKGTDRRTLSIKPVMIRQR